MKRNLIALSIAALTGVVISFGINVAWDIFNLNGEDLASIAVAILVFSTTSITSYLIWKNLKK